MNSEPHTEIDDAANNNAAVLEIGEILDGKYKVETFLGRGGMGAVYRAHHIELGNKVAVKVMHPRFAVDSAAVKRFQMEARTIARLRHKNILSVHAFGSVSGLTYMAMEYIEGESLATRIFEYGRLKPSDAMPLLRQICDAMTYAHENGVLHRDLKPDNTVIIETADSGTQVKVVDFGLAKLLDGDDIQKLTQTGEVVGDPNYMSPEQCQGRPLDERSDIYSFGCMMYEMFSGEKPFRAETPVSILYMQVSSPPPPFAARLGLPASLEAIVLTAMAKDPNDRYESFAVLSKLLDEFATNPDLKIKAPKSTQLLPSRRAQIMRALTLTSCLVALCALGFGLFYSAKKTEKEQQRIANEEKLRILQRDLRTKLRPLPMSDAKEIVSLAEQVGNRGALAEGRALLADSYLTAGQLEEANDEANAALNMPELSYATRPLMRNLAAYTAYALRRNEQAEQHYEQIYSSERHWRPAAGEGQGSAAHNLAELKLRLGKVSEAAEIIADLNTRWVERAGKLNPNKLLQLDLLFHKGQLKQAEELMREIEKQPLNPKETMDCLSHYTLNYIKFGDVVGAKRALSQFEALQKANTQETVQLHDRTAVLTACLQARQGPPDTLARTGRLFERMITTSQDIWSLRTLGECYAEQLNTSGQAQQALEVKKRTDKRLSEIRQAKVRAARSEAKS